LVVTHSLKKLIKQTVEKHDQGNRVDHYLSSLSKLKLSRAIIKKLIATEHILVDGRSTKPSVRLKGGEVVTIEIPPSEPPKLLPEEIPIQVLFEDKDLIIIDKPAGMVVHPGAGCKSGTLVNALLFHCNDLSTIGGPLRPGLVHRLDKETSGLIVVAKNDHAHHFLSKQFADRKVTKKYWAFVWDEIHLPHGQFDQQIGRSTSNRKKMSSGTTRGKPARTEWRVVERFPHVTWVEASPKTGRTHQIRVHFAESGHPLVQDTTYGGGLAKRKKIPHELISAAKMLGRHALHAFSLSFHHPESNEIMAFESPLPSDLALFERALRLLK
jgi:23S rRNA pseudouridine1911/1915/1917 synthase